MQADQAPHQDAPAITRLADGRIHSLIVGAGPSGLATAHKLSQAGIVPLIVERGASVGGLMRSVAHGDFIVDIGRKELYTRIPEVDRLWHDLLRSDYRAYDHRVGSLYRGRILELSGAYRGMTRGLPLPWLAHGALDLIRSWVGARWSKPANYQDYWHQRAGPYFSRLFAQGYWEKFRGQAWSDMAVPQTEVDGSDVRSYSFDAIRQGLKLASQGGPQRQKEWRHPARGSGQIADVMLERLNAAGVRIALETAVTSIKLDQGRVCEVTTQSAEGIEKHQPCHVVTSMQIEELAALLDDTSATDAPSEVAPAGSEQSVILVYLLTDEPCRFPHAWLEVNDPDLKCGRITNYAAFNGDMVPDGKGCLCVEYFCVGDDPILGLSKEQMEALAVEECVDNKLVDPARLTDIFTTTIRRTHAAASWRDWQKAHKLRLLRDVSRVENLYHVNRPGMDWATFAGMMASESILEGSRAGFDQRADPTRRYAEHEVGAQASGQATAQRAPWRPAVGASNGQS